jgi:hypothetical protein
MSRGVEAPLALTAIAVAVGNGWIEAVWNWMYTTTHTGSTGGSRIRLLPQNPITKSGGSTVTPFTNPTTGQPTGSGTVKGLPPDVIPNNPQTNPTYS